VWLSGAAAVAGGSHEKEVCASGIPLLPLASMKPIFSHTSAYQFSAPAVLAAGPGKLQGRWRNPSEATGNFDHQPSRLFKQIDLQNKNV
jgi:hypothetical protein